MESIELLMAAWKNGDISAKNKLIERMYPELKRAAQFQFSKERPNHTMQATALVNEAYERLIKLDTSWQSKTHFLNLSAKIMRQILVDFARSKNRLKRGGDNVRVTLVEETAIVDEENIDVIALDQALKLLEARDEVSSKMIEQRVFAGMTNQQIADANNVSLATVERKIQFAKAWLYKQLDENN